MQIVGVTNHIGVAVEASLYYIYTQAYISLLHALTSAQLLQNGYQYVQQSCTIRTPGSMKSVTGRHIG